MLETSGWVLLAILCLIRPAAHAAQPSVVHLQAGSHSLDLTPYLRYRHDASGSQSHEAIYTGIGQGKFAPLPDGRTAFGFQKGAYWFHARIVNDRPDEPRWLLLQEYALSDHVDV